jgi:bifunctional UDP-N-acetylglucosamine pyrophosphorylase/glucosamine-1-phosphate N-acetyltransferase
LSTVVTDPSTVEIAALILAAGKSTRMKSKTPKALHPLLGKPLLRYAAEAVQNAGARRTVIVIGHEAHLVRAALGEGFEYALQAEQRGTGDAVAAAEQLLRDWTGPVLVLPGDAPLISSSLLEELIAHHRKTNAAATLLTAILDDAGAYGRIVRDPDGRVRRIVEARDASDDELRIGEIGTSIYLFEPAKLFTSLKQVTPRNAQGEYYLTDVIALLAEQGETVEALVSPDADVVRGVNTREELVGLSEVLRARILRTHLLAGVTILDPISTHIDADVRIGADTVVHPFTVLTGVTDIGEDCVIGPGARISDSKLGDGVIVRDSWVVASTIGDGTRIGPYANLRPGNVVGKDVKIGDFVELKQAVIGDDVSAGHFAYLGDAEVGARTNIGAGTITCNYDGKRKSKTVVGADVFVGTHTTLVAPVTVGDRAFVAAGSTITDDVPADSLAIARERQTVKEGWAARRREGG